MSEAWAARAADRSPSVRRSRARSLQQARVIVDAARRLIAEKGENFTTQELIKEAGVALQTFYRYFGSKDELVLAVIEEMIAESCELWKEQSRGIDDPVERLRTYVISALASLSTQDGANARFIASEHWRLSALFPEEVALATKQFADLAAAEIASATALGLLRSADPERDGWFITQFVLSVFHQQSFAPTKDPAIPADLWRLVLGALGGNP
jgi:TetR/AcrR family transcriptional regulator